MKFAAGFQYRNQGELFSDMLPDYRPQLAEVYFSYPGFASGRPERSTCLPDALEQIEYELHKIRTMGIKLDLLINGNCYGPGAVSERFYREIAQLMERLNSLSLLPEIVTTTSPFAAHSLRKLAPDIEIRASVNMRIETVLRICNVLHITPDSILTEEDTAIVVRQEELMARLGKCRPKDRETALRLLAVYLDSLE